MPPSSEQQAATAATKKNETTPSAFRGYGSIKGFDELVNDASSGSNRTSPMITRYERANVLGIRTEQIARGAQPFVEHQGDAAQTALKEFMERRTPLVVVRHMPDGGKEYWRISDMAVW